MRTRTLATLTTAAAAVLALTGCSSSSDSHDNAADPAKTTATAASKVDCQDPKLSQTDWMAHCSKSGNTAATSLHKQFGQTYTWPDGVKVTITQAKIFTAYDKDLDETPTKGSTDYQVMIKIVNGGHAQLDLNTLSIITAGATNGGEAESTSWNNAAPGLEGRVAPGVTVTKADPETLATKFGRRIVVTVQRMEPDNSDVMAFPEFTGSITG